MTRTKYDITVTLENNEKLHYMFGDKICINGFQIITSEQLKEGDFIEYTSPKFSFNRERIIKIEKRGIIQNGNDSRNV